MAKVLLHHGADIDAEDNLGDTALIKATKRGSYWVAKLLVEHDADLYIKNNAGETALAIAEQRGHTTISTLLRKAGARSSDRSN
ncbi:MAG: hypothetical protein CMJ78_20155 [Planctomycetaceae bacterium]|nr:hypothetical protein [Planctomycetaceae bacterium]